MTSGTGLRTKILSVDDMPANLLAMRAILEPLGHEVLDAPSGPRALELAAREEFAVVLLDVMMPTMDGLETLERLRKTPLARHTPVILVTAGQTELTLHQRAYALGAVDYVTKPLSAEILRGKVSSLVSLHLVNQELRARDAALAVKDRYIGVLAHDLRNPLNVVAGTMKVLLRSNLGDHERRSAERGVRAAERMASMVRDLLDYARAGAGQIPVERARTDLAVLGRELIDDFQVAHSNLDIGLVCEGDLCGEWDEARLYQALSNLLSNAVQYGGDRVRLTLADGGEHVDALVWNAGPPIPRDILPELFQPFRRGQAAGTGLGLGLYIVNEIARAHQGEVSVESTAVEGTTFCLHLPRTPMSRS